MTATDRVVQNIQSDIKKRRAMKEQTRYAGTLHRTPHAATLAAVGDFLTATGQESVEDTIQALEEEREEILDELERAIRAGDWYLPNAENPIREDLEDYVDEWIEDNA